MQYWQYPNRVVLGGRISTDLELKEVKENNKILNFSIANNLNATGENRGSKVGHFFRCEAWGKTAELIAQHFQKGDAIMLDGSLHWSSWQHKETGEKRETIRLRVENFFFPEPASRNKDRTHGTDDGDRDTPPPMPSNMRAQRPLASPLPNSAARRTPSAGPTFYPVKGKTSGSSLGPPVVDPADDEIPY